MALTIPRSCLGPQSSLPCVCVCFLSAVAAAKAAGTAVPWQDIAVRLCKRTGHTQFTKDNCSKRYYNLRAAVTRAGSGEFRLARVTPKEAAAIKRKVVALMEAEAARVDVDDDDDDGSDGEKEGSGSDGGDDDDDTVHCAVVALMWC